MPRKAKKRVHPMPKLGWKDQLLYWSAMILTGGGSLSSLFIVLLIQDAIAFADERVVANTVGSGFLNMFYLMTWLMVAFVLIVTTPYQNRFPVFGRTDIKYGPPAYPRVYPLLMKNKPQYWVSPKETARKKKCRIIIAAVLLVTFLFSLAMFPLSFYGRSVLHRDGTVVVYDELNRETAVYGIRDISAVRLDTYRSSGGRYSSGDWYAEMVVEFSDGERCRFAVHSFDGDDIHRLETMLFMKVQYGTLVSIEGTENLQKVVRDQHLDEAEQELLHQLFSLDS